MIAFQSAQGIDFWKPHEVASIMPEFRNWWRGVHRDGRVAHRPTPPPAGPWVPHAGGFVNARWLIAGEGKWIDPGQFVLSGGELPISPLEGESPFIPELGMRAEQVYALRKVTAKQEVIWYTDQGEIHWPKFRLQDAAALHPDLLLLRQGTYLNRNRLHSVRSDGVYRRIFYMDNGREFAISWNVLSAAQALGLSNYMQMDPPLEERFWDNQLRDWPLDLSRASADYLRSHFKTPRQLIANLIWQRFRDRQAGIFKRWGDGYRGFWYAVLVHALHKAGFLESAEITREVSLVPHRAKLSQADALYQLSHVVMGYLVDFCRFFDFRQFGFKDSDPEGFRVGALRPDILLITEKDDCLPFARKLAREFGVSHYHLGSQPSLLRSEFVAERLLKVTASVRAVAYVDYDSGGWILGQAAVDQLANRGLGVTRLDYLLREECFTEEEKRLHSHPCKMGGAGQRTKVRQWIEKGGGLNGEPRGIFASYVEPYARVRKLFGDLLGLVKAP